MDPDGLPGVMYRDRLAAVTGVLLLQDMVTVEVWWLLLDLMREHQLHWV